MNVDTIQPFFLNSIRFCSAILNAWGGIVYMRENEKRPEINFRRPKSISISHQIQHSVFRKHSGDDYINKAMPSPHKYPEILH